MPGEKHIVKFWRGTRENYNSIATAGLLDYWTRYSVKEPGGQWTEYYGSNPISTESGQLLPVLDIAKENLPSPLNPGDRYILEEADGLGKKKYSIIEVRIENLPGGGSKANSCVIPLKDGMSVRVKSKGYMSYQIVDGELITYDEVDCGEY